MNLCSLLFSRRWMALVLLVAACTAAHGGPARTCLPPPPTPTAEERDTGWRDARDRGFLWRATKDGRSSYLYGTVHVGRPAWMFLGPTIRDAITISDIVALELDLANPEVARRIQAAMGPRKDRSLTPKLEARLNRQLEAACMPLELARTVSPEMLGLALTMMAARHEGLDAAFGADAAVAALSRELGKPVTSLESPEFQISLLTSRSNAELREGLDKLLGSLETGKAGPVVTRIAKIWDEGREDELSRYPEWCDCTGSARERATLKALLDDRNPGLADTIDALHTEGKKVFAAIGSLHMIGAGGVPARLRARGYKVERIALPRPPG